jgi:hypothetical protein
MQQRHISKHDLHNLRNWLRSFNLNIGCILLRVGLKNQMDDKVFKTRTMILSCRFWIKMVALLVYTQFQMSRSRSWVAKTMIY